MKVYISAQVVKLLEEGRRRMYGRALAGRREEGRKGRVRGSHNLGHGRQVKVYKSAQVVKLLEDCGRRVHVRARPFAAGSVPAFSQSPTRSTRGARFRLSGSRHVRQPARSLGAGAALQLPHAWQLHHAQR